MSFSVNDDYNEEPVIFSKNDLKENVKDWKCSNYWYWWGKKLFQDGGGKKLVIQCHSSVSCNINGDDT